MAVKIVTDSTADLPPELVRELDITVIPQNLHFGEETFLDGVDMDTDTFFERLVSSSQLPRTSQPSPGVFLETYRELTQAGHQVIAIHVSDKLSGTLNSARQAVEQLGDAAIELLDSAQASVGLGLVVTAVANTVRQGASYEEALQTARTAIGEVQVFALLDTLEYMQRGGRIGKVRAIIGGLLRVRPIITVKDGVAQSEATARSRALGMRYMRTVAEDRAPLKQVAVVYSTNSEEADELEEMVRPFTVDGNVIRTRFGPVLGTYLGPGAVGIAIQSEKTG